MPITRRKVVGASALGGSLLGYAYRDPLELGVLGALRGYPGPGDGELPGTELGFKARAVEGRSLVGEEYRLDIALITSRDEASALSLDRMDDEIRAFVDETGFDGSSLLAVQVIGSADSKGVRFVGVERLKDGTLHSYSCVTRPSRHDDAYLYGWLVRVDTGSHSGVARHSHGAPESTGWRPGDELRHRQRRALPFDHLHVRYPI